MRPTGRLHLGNYLGALKNWVSLQDDYQCFYFVADWHALTTEYADTSQIEEWSVEIVLDWLAAGLDPERSVLFLQSQLLEHAELSLIFSMLTPVSWLERNPTYKDLKQELKHKDLATHGFLGYPVLQAADILIYKPRFVPVGVDQLPHLELTREIARRFNNFYGEIFPEPQPVDEPDNTLGVIFPFPVSTHKDKTAFGVYFVVKIEGFNKVFYLFIGGPFSDMQEGCFFAFKPEAS